MSENIGFPTTVQRQVKREGVFEIALPVEIALSRFEVVILSDVGGAHPMQNLSVESFNSLDHRCTTVKGRGEGREGAPEDWAQRRRPSWKLERRTRGEHKRNVARFGRTKTEDVTGTETNRRDCGVSQWGGAICEWRVVQLPWLYW